MAFAARNLSGGQSKRGGLATGSESPFDLAHQPIEFVDTIVIAGAHRIFDQLKHVRYCRIAIFFNSIGGFIL